IEFGDSYKAPPEETGKGPTSESSAKKKGRTVVITTEDMQKRRNDVKARTTLLLALPDDHQLRFSKDDLDTMSLDDVYNHLKVYESEVQKKSESNSQNMAFISSSNTISVKATQSNGSQIKYKDITQIDKDDIEEMDKKCNMALLSMRADRFWKKTGKKITIHGSDVAGFDKLKVECFNCHKMGHFARECRAPRSQDKGLERDVEIRDNKIEYLKNELEKVKKEKESLDNKLTGFENASKDLDNLLGSQRSNKNKEGLGYNAVPSPPAQIYSPPKKDLSWTGLPEFVDDTVTDYSRPAQIYSPPKKDLSWTVKSKVRTQPRVPRVSNVTKQFPTVHSKFLTAKLTFTADLGNKGKAIKASACWIWRPKQNTTEKGLNCNSVSVTFKKYQYIDTQGRRLISWQCKKQTIVATSTTEAEYMAAASGCGQVL
nr:hypothetical protein [Tanacetum cinerariifolium]